MMTANAIIEKFRYKVSDSSTIESEQLFSDDIYRELLNDALFTLYGNVYEIGAVPDELFPKYSLFAEMNFYYKLARDTAFYFKYKEAQGDDVDKTKTPKYFLDLAMAKEKLYFKLYGKNLGALGTTASGIGQLFSIGS